MTDITDQDRRKALAWAGGSQAIGIADAAARVILATVDAPAPTLAEDILDAAARIRDAVNPGDRDVSWADMESCADRAAQMEHDLAEACAEVERLTAERVTDPSPTLNDGSMMRPATVAREENVSPDLPDPADVKPGETWIVNIDGVEIVPGFKASVGWICYRLFDGTTKAIGDERITLVSRLVPAPRTITTREELDRLAEGAIVRDKDGDAWRRTCDEWTTTADYGRFTSWAVSRSGPVTVLWEPEVAS